MARLINGFAEKGLMLPKSESAEIVGLAVDESCHGQGLGAAVVDSLVAEARALGIRIVFAMTL